MDVRTAEFDNFGPWIVAVATPDEVPPLYRDHPLDLGAARTVLKIPRNIARRDAHPGMDLYDQLVIVDDASLTVLHRSESGGYGTASIGLADIVAYEDSVDLLDGLLSVRSGAGDEVRIPYNGSSRSTIAALIRVLRQGAAGTAPEHAPGLGTGTGSGAGSVAASAAAAASLAPSPYGPGAPLPATSSSNAAPGSTPIGPDSVGRDSLALLANYRDFCRVADTAVSAAAHLSRPLASAPHTAGGFVDGIWRKVLHGAVVAVTRTDVVVFSRRDWISRKSAPTTSEALRIIPLAGLTAVTHRPHDRFADVTVVSLISGATTTDIVVPADAETAALLATLARALPA